MKTKTIKGKCCPVSGYEENYLRFFVDAPDKTGYVGATNLLDEPPIDASVETAFEYEKLTKEEINDARSYKLWLDIIETYRSSTGKQYPPVYSVKITVEYEELTDEESKELWEQESLKFKKQYNEE